MIGLPPSPFTDSGATDCSPEQAATSHRQEGVAADHLDLIGEIFVGAAKLEDPEPRFQLDVQAFMDAIDEPPLFLRRA